jgi:hypothetical protein
MTDRNNTPPNEAVELKPCPFCGSDAFLEIKGCYVRCISCCVDGPVFDNWDEDSNGELEAAKLWNARKVPEPSTTITLEMVAAGEAEFRRRCGNALPENKAECEAAVIAIHAAMEATRPEQQNTDINAVDKTEAMSGVGGDVTETSGLIEEMKLAVGGLEKLTGKQKHETERITGHSINALAFLYVKAITALTAASIPQPVDAGELPEGFKSLNDYLAEVAAENAALQSRIGMLEEAGDSLAETLKIYKASLVAALTRRELPILMEDLDGWNRAALNKGASDATK